MNTNSTNLALAENYYRHMLAKNFDAMAECLHSDIEFIGPLSEMRGRKPVAEAARNLSAILHNIEIRSRFSDGNQIMFAYDLIFPDPIGKLRAAVLMDFRENLIAKIELFYDARPFEERKSEIFRN